MPQVASQRGQVRYTVAMARSILPGRRAQGMGVARDGGGDGGGGGGGDGGGDGDGDGDGARDLDPDGGLGGAPAPPGSCVAEDLFSECRGAARAIAPTNARRS